MGRLFKKLQKEKFRLLLAEAEHFSKGIVYVRYADSWALVMTTTRQRMTKIKTKINQFIYKELSMELNQKKTKIEKLTEGFHFLGFSLRLKSAQNTYKNYLINRKKGPKHTTALKRALYNLKHAICRKITVIPDVALIRNKLIENGYCKNNYFPLAKRPFSLLNEFQIVWKYEQM